MQKFQPATPRHFSSIDWELIDKIDPLRVVQKGSNEELRSFIRSFCDFRISYEDKSFGHPSSWKLLKLLQISIDYLVEIQEKLAQSIIQKNSTLKRTKKKYKDIKTNYLKALNLAESLQREIDICPVCHKKYMNAQFVDSHVKKRHPDVYSYWKVIRSKNPSADDYLEVLDNAKSKIKNHTKISISKSVSFDMKTQSIRNEKAEAKGNRNISSIFKSNNDITSGLSLEVNHLVSVAPCSINEKEESKKIALSKARSYVFKQESLYDNSVPLIDHIQNEIKNEIATISKSIARFYGLTVVVNTFWIRVR